MKTQKILIVDDNPQNIQVAASILSREDIELAFAESGKEAISRLERGSYDLILMDVMMPEMDGFETVRHIKQIDAYKRIPIIFVTAKAAEEDVIEGFYSGGVDYVTKPFQQKELLARVQTHLLIKNYRDDLEAQVDKEVEKRMELERENKLQEQLLIQQSKMAEMGEMIAAITHQLRSPITSLCMIPQNVIEMKSCNDLSDDELMSHMNQMIKSANFMNQTINDFKNFLKPDKRKQLFSPLKCAHEINKMLSDQMMKDKVNVIVQGDDEITVYGVKNELTQVLMSLLKNARDAFIENNIHPGLITVHVKKQENFVVITSKDNGGGITDALLPDKLFEPYISTKGDKGTGIGLALSRKIIKESFDGTLKARNVSGGAEFIIEVPLKREE